MIRRSFLVLLLASAVAPVPPAVADSISATGPSYVHVVLVWLKEPGNMMHRRRVIEASRRFEALPGVLQVRVGESVQSDREVVDDSFDVGLYLTFASQEDLQAYLVDERHKATLRDVLKPLTARYIVYDFFDDGGHHKSLEQHGRHDQ